MHRRVKGERDLREGQALRGMADPGRAAEVRQRLLDLALDASTYLRQHRSRAVRVSAALLLATSLAACSPSGSEMPDGTAAVQPLQQEVRQGLPTTPGRYPLESTTVSRDEQGLYQFRWRDGSSPTAQWNPASASLMRLAPGQWDELEVPAQGDPILHLKSTTPIGLTTAAGPELEPTPQPSTGGSTSSSSSSYRSSGAGVRWYPFDAGGSDGARTTSAPAYYDPPRQATIAQGAVRGAIVSTTAPPPSSRVSGLLRSGSTPTGGAASAKAGLTGGNGPSSPSSGWFSQGASRPGGFFGGGG
jgi:hypothetical protein